jgi:hypothetical protein
MTRGTESTKVSTTALLFAIALGCGSREAAPAERLVPTLAPDADVETGGLAGAVGDGKGPTCGGARITTTRPPVDLVMIVDQSGSMADDIANLQRSINGLAELLSAFRFDYRLVMIASHGDPFHTFSKAYEVCVPPPLGGATCGAPNGSKFRQINRNVQSNDALKILLETVGATSGPLAFRDLLRPNATKVVIPVTDDDSVADEPATSCSDADYADPKKQGCVPNAETFDRLVLSRANGLFGSPSARSYVVYPLVGAARHPSEQVCGSQVVNAGAQYLALAKRTGGKWAPICESDFLSIFRGLAADLAGKVSCVVPVPAADPGFDRDRVNLDFVTAGGVRRRVYQAGEGPCDDVDGWRYDASGTKIEICGQACRDVRAEPTGRLEIELGCKTEIR